MSGYRRTVKTYKVYQRFVGNRPHCLKMKVVNAGMAVPLAGNALVDTGADHSILPATMATMAGLPLPPPKRFPTLGASVQVHEVVNCPLEIEGQLIHVTVLFDPSGTLPPILGRDALLKRCEFGFNTVEWMWD